MKLADEESLVEMQNSLGDMQEQLDKEVESTNKLQRQMKQKDALVEDLQAQLATLLARTADEKLEIVTRYEEQHKQVIHESDPDFAQLLKCAKSIEEQMNE